MKEIELQAKNVEEAISEFCRLYKVEKQKVDYQVINPGSKGFFNLLGTKPATVKFVIPDIEDNLTAFLTGFMNRIPVIFKEITVKKFKEENQEIYDVEVFGVEDQGFLIGKEGRFLDSLQHLLNRHANQLREGVRVKLDIGNYKRKIEKKFFLMLRDVADSVKQKNKPVTLEPMNASERRRVHQYIKRDRMLHTLTIGEGEMKRVAILPIKYDKDKFQKSLSK